MAEPLKACERCDGNGGWYIASVCTTRWSWADCMTCFGTGRSDAPDPDEGYEHGLLTLLDEDMTPVVPARAVGLVRRNSQMYIDRDLVYDTEAFYVTPATIAYYSIERDGGDIVTTSVPPVVHNSHELFTLIRGWP